MDDEYERIHYNAEIYRNDVGRSLNCLAPLKAVSEYSEERVHPVDYDRYNCDRVVRS